jgi:riboflavin transporter 2
MLANSRPTIDIYPTSTNRFHLKAVVYALVAIFGLGTWTNLSGIWIELPIIVPILPESWQLPAKLTLLINLANIFPIAIVFASLIFKLDTTSFEVPVNFILLLSSITFAIAFASLWDKTAYLFGTEQSVSLMLLCFFSAIADCMSSTTFIPFLHRYEPVYLNAYFFGEALTALLPALLGIIQGIGKSDCVLIGNRTNGTLIEIYHQPRFSVRTYFIILSLLPLAALLAFSTLRLMKTGRLKTKSSIKESKHYQSRIFILMDNIEDMNFIQNTVETINKIENQLKNRKENYVKKFILSEPGIFLFITFQCSAILYGACQGLTTFSLNAYSETTFHYTIIASQFAYPIMTLIGVFIPEVPSKIVYFLYLISTGLFVYIFLTVCECIDNRKKIFCA